nr:hypothetical protein CFP56_72170 [Quercus suber]
MIQMNQKTEKHLQLNSAINDVSAQLCGDDAPNGAAVNSDKSYGAQSLGVKPGRIQLCQTGAQGLGMKPGCIQIENLISLRGYPFLLWP